MTATNDRDLTRLWEIHQAAEWPVGVGSHEGELMTLDTVVSGCATYYFEEHELDPQRVAILEDCLSESGGRTAGIERSPLGLFRAGSSNWACCCWKRVADHDMKRRLAAASRHRVPHRSLTTGATAAELTFVALGDMPYGPREQDVPRIQGVDRGNQQPGSRLYHPHRRHQIR